MHIKNITAIAFMLFLTSCGGSGAEETSLVQPVENEIINPSPDIDMPDDDQNGDTGSGQNQTDPDEISLDQRALFVGGNYYQIKGICWNPTPKGQYQSAANYSIMDDIDIPLMQSLGINTIRTYDSLTDIEVLDNLYNAGIKVINGVYIWGGTSVNTVIANVNAVKNHPAILMWALGNEWNYNGLYYGDSFENSVSKINQVAAAIKAVDTIHPIATIYGELPSSDLINRMPDIDVWGINSYRGISFGTLFSQWASRSAKPMFLAEYGADAFNANTNVNAEDTQSQALAVDNLTREILDHSIAYHTDGTVLGGTIFEWSDEWWKASGSYSVHDTGGIAPGGGPYPDNTFNEEWWGIVDIDRHIRPAYTALQQLYSNYQSTR